MPWSPTCRRDTGSPDDRYARPHQALRPPARGRPGRPRRPGGRPVRVPRAQRLREDHCGPDAARPGLRDQRRDLGAGPAGTETVGRGAALDRLAGRGPVRVRSSVRPGQPGPDRRGRQVWQPPDPAQPDRRHPGPGRPGRHRQPPGQEILPRHAPAARPGRRPAAHPETAHPRRADQRPGPAGHPGDPRPADRAERGRHHSLPVQPPAQRGRAAVHPGRDREPRPAGPAGRPGHAARADRAVDRPDPRHRPGP